MGPRDNSHALLDLTLMFNKFQPESIQEKVQKAKENSTIADTIEELVCLEHPFDRFQRSRSIPWSMAGAEEFQERTGRRKGRLLDVYSCAGCLEQGRYPDAAEAYECPSCGFVLGRYMAISEELPGDGRLMPGPARSEIYVCRICDSWLGHDYKVV